MPKFAKDIEPSSDAPVRTDELLAIARAAGDGDPGAIATLIHEVGGSMLRNVRKVVGWQHPDTEDITQDALLALLRGLPTFRAECSVQNFANRVALLTALSARRKLRDRLRLVGSGDDGQYGEPQVASDGATPLQQAVSSRRRELLLGVLERLPEKTAEALALHFILGHTVEEIAEAAAVSPNTIWSRLRLGKEALRRGMANDVRLRELFDEGRS